VNFTKICVCFSFADVTQNVDMRSSKNLRLSKLLGLILKLWLLFATHFGVATHRLGTIALNHLNL